MAQSKGQNRLALQFSTQETPLGYQFWFSFEIIAYEFSHTISSQHFKVLITVHIDFCQFKSVLEWQSHFIPPAVHY